MAKRKSSRKTARVRMKERTTARRKAPRARREKLLPVSDISRATERLSNGIAFVSTAANSLQASQDSTCVVRPGDLGDDITALVHGVRFLRRAYDELEVAIQTVLP